MRLEVSKLGILFIFNGWRKAAHLLNKNTPRTSPQFRTEIKAKIIKGDDGRKLLKVINGVTGYEEWYLDSLIKNDIPGDFLVCAGTHNRWDQLGIFEEDWKVFKTKYKRIFNA